MNTLEYVTTTKIQWIKEVRALLSDDPEWADRVKEGSPILHENMTRAQFAAVSRGLLSTALALPDFYSEYDAEEVKTWFLKASSARRLLAQGCKIFIPHIRYSNAMPFTNRLLLLWGRTHADQDKAMEMLRDFKL